MSLLRRRRHYSRQKTKHNFLTKSAPQVKQTSNKPTAMSTVNAYQVPFVEKYRPKTLDDVVGNRETVERLRAMAVDGNVPHLILCGPPGTGKTTSIHALAHELLGLVAYKNAVLELNASDARGIDVRTCLMMIGLSLEPWITYDGFAHWLQFFFSVHVRWCAIESKALP
jgi:chromosomal replication initiation ATPase DnaA